MYSIAKIHYTTITMNKEGAARFVKKKKKNDRNSLQVTVPSENNPKLDQVKSLKSIDKTECMRPVDDKSLFLKVAHTNQ